MQAFLPSSRVQVCPLPNHILVANVILVYQSPKQENKMIWNPQNDTYSGMVLWSVWMVFTSEMNHSRVHLTAVQDNPFEANQRAVVWSTPEFEWSSHTVQTNCIKGETLQGLGWCEPAFRQCHWLDEQWVLIKAHWGSRQLQDVSCRYWVSLIKHKTRCG